MPDNAPHWGRGRISRSSDMGIALPTCSVRAARIGPRILGSGMWPRICNSPVSGWNTVCSRAQGIELSTAEIPSCNVLVFCAVSPGCMNDWIAARDTGFIDPLPDHASEAIPFSAGRVSVELPFAKFSVAVAGADTVDKDREAVLVAMNAAGLVLVTWDIGFTADIVCEDSVAMTGVGLDVAVSNIGFSLIFGVTMAEYIWVGNVVVVAFCGLSAVGMAENWR